jgi:hypothetical protein
MRMRTVAAILGTVCAVSACAPTTVMLVSKNGQNSVMEGELPRPIEQTAVILWAGSMGDYPELLSIDGATITSAATNNRLEVVPGRHQLVYVKSIVPGTFREKQETVSEVFVLEPGRCYNVWQNHVTYENGAIMQNGTVSSGRTYDVLDRAHLEDMAHPKVPTSVPAFPHGLCSR